MSRKQKDQITEAAGRYGWDAQAAIDGIRINPYESLGGKRSAHGVLFGKLATGQEVVVKPHPNRGKAERELKVAKQIAELGLPITERVGLYHGHEAAYLVTKKAEGLWTLKDHDWRISIADTAGKEKLLPMLGMSGESLALLHNHDVTHGDFQVKNVAFRPDNSPIFIDLEKAHVGTRGGRDVHDRVADLYLLGGSIANEGLFYDRSPSFRVGALQEHLISPYETGLYDRETDMDLVAYALSYSARNGFTPLSKIVGPNLGHAKMDA